MRLFALSTAAILAFSSPALAVPERYGFDKEHTTIGFAVSHLGYSHMVGSFTAYDGYFVFDREKPENSKVEVTIDPKGVRTASAELDKHLQNEKFFNTAQFPDAKFVSTEVKTTGPSDGTITGSLTLLGVTKPVTLNVHFNKASAHPMTGQMVAGFSATGVIKRSDFGMSAYVPDVGDEVKLSFEVEGMKQESAPSGAKKP